MELKDALIEEQCFIVERSIATLTIEDEDQKTMIPWISLKHATWQKGLIQLHFHDWRVDIMGASFDELWTALQHQSVQILRKSTNSKSGSCFIRMLGVSAVKEEEESTDQHSSLF